ncbi:hypothetical protein Dsin_013642 [Dipteronia sinensis]|uniref:Reverse transcriptase domain-containing protein n=1 Tax=Dipteronia sinensis TaxID=43782 RepID=A0AAE0ALH1_9ROSI|nr:hypothetical protein Dsin_013642 [Dipteronia sinensis]
MKEAVRGWRGCKVKGLNGKTLFSKLKASKVFMKKWLSSNRDNTSTKKVCEDRIGAVDSKAEREGWTDTLRKERTEILSGLWTAVRREGQKWRQRVKWLKEGASFGDAAVHVSHLQFADDTIIFLEPEEEYLRNFKRILRCFELAAGLRINFHKSCVVKVGKKGLSDDGWAEVFGCNKAELPITYFGFPLDGRPTENAFWRPLLHRIEGSKRNRGLGIGKMAVKNKSLLAKWIWRFGSENSSLWRRVICAKYGVLLDNLFWDWKASRSASFFVKAVGSLLEIGSMSEKVLKDGLKVVIGSGNKADFWNDRYGFDLTLNIACPRIYALALNKNGRVADYRKWDGLRWEWEVKMRRPVFDWEKNQMAVLLNLLECLKIRRHISDVLAW